MVRWIATKEEHAQKIMTTTVPVAARIKGTSVACAICADAEVAASSCSNSHTHTFIRIYIYIYQNIFLSHIHTYIHYSTVQYITLHYITYHNKQTYIHTYLHYSTLHYITYHHIPVHTITYHSIPLHTITLWYAIRCSLGLPRSFSCCMLYSCFTSVFGSSCAARVARLGWLGVANVAPLTARLFASKRQLRPSVWACSQLGAVLGNGPVWIVRGSRVRFAPLNAACLWGRGLCSWFTARPRYERSSVWRS